MINMLKSWPGEVEINGQHYNSINDVPGLDLNTLNDNMCIKLLHKSNTSQNEAPGERQTISKSDDDLEYRILVKPYMTKPATPEFDFMAQWNNNKPMPIREMQGTVEKETRGMVYMKLHGYGKSTITCMCCGKELTNPVSRHYGIGPICLSKIGISNNIDDVNGITEALAKIEWEGWIIKSAILDNTPVVNA